ncbi:hypothetical protein GCM10010404_19700 [Nonomuraea africana]
MLAGADDPDAVHFHLFGEDDRAEEVDHAEQGHLAQPFGRDSLIPSTSSISASSILAPARAVMVAPNSGRTSAMGVS